jgi:hypothetical protein
MYGPRQLNDTYLLDLAVSHEVSLVTFDTGIPLAAVRKATTQNLLILQAVFLAESNVRRISVRLTRMQVSLLNSDVADSARIHRVVATDRPIPKRSLVGVSHIRIFTPANAALPAKIPEVKFSTGFMNIPLNVRNRTEMFHSWRTVHFASQR